MQCWLCANLNWCDCMCTGNPTIWQNIFSMAYMEWRLGFGQDWDSASVNYYFLLNFILHFYGIQTEPKGRLYIREDWRLIWNRREIAEWYNHHDIFPRGPLRLKSCTLDSEINRNETRNHERNQWILKSQITQITCSTSLLLSPQSTWQRSATEIRLEFNAISWFLTWFPINQQKQVRNQEIRLLEISWFRNLVRFWTPWPGVENIADHGTIGPRKFFMLAEWKKGRKKKGERKKKGKKKNRKKESNCSNK